MPNSSGNRFQVEKATSEDAPNSVSIELSSGAEIDSLVLAYQDDGELVELAERTLPASAELSGELE